MAAGAAELAGAGAGAATDVPKLNEGTAGFTESAAFASAAGAGGGANAGNTGATTAAGAAVDVETVLAGGAAEPVEAAGVGSFKSKNPVNAGAGGAATFGEGLAGVSTGDLPAPGSAAAGPGIAPSSDVPTAGIAGAVLGESTLGTAGNPGKETDGTAAGAATGDLVVVVVGAAGAGVDGNPGKLTLWAAAGVAETAGAAVDVLGVAGSVSNCGTEDGRAATFFSCRDREMERRVKGKDEKHDKVSMGGGHAVRLP